MQLIEDIILPRLQAEQTIFVFPSEVAARIIQRQALEAARLDVSPNNRFISWDQFKERIIRARPDAVPANSYTRILFAERMCAENRKRPYFKSLIRPEFADNSAAYLNHLCGLLPVLHRFRGLKPRLALTADQGKLHDLELLLGRYKEFLDANDLYEPDYEPAVLQPDQTDYLVFFPEVIKDFPALDVSGANGGRIPCIPTEEPARPSQPELTVFPNTIIEVKAVLHNIGRLLDKGEPPSNIVITLAAPDGISPYLKEQARLLGLELDFHQGKDLSSYPGVSFLSHLRQVYGSGFSVTEIAGLVRDCALPWKNGDLARELVRFGIRFNCLKNYTDRGKQIDIWRHNFRRLTQSKDYSANELAELSDFYLGLKTQITAVNTAPDFRELYVRIKNFTDTFFSASFFADQASGYYEFALRLLQELIDSSARVKLAAPESAFGLWLAVIAKKKYVEQSPRRGIAVYPYRVSAGIQPSYHFIINASQANTRYIIREFPFLHVDEEAALERQDLDLSDPLLALYLGSGENVMISYSRRDFSDTHLPPGFFLSRGRILEYRAADDRLNPDPLYSELELWKEKTAGAEKNAGAIAGQARGARTADARAVQPRELFPLQKQGFLRACTTVLAPKSIDYLASPVDDASLAGELFCRLPHENGMLRISPTGLGMFWDCAFAFLLSQGLDLVSENYEPQLLDPLWIGKVIHRVFELFFAELKKGGGTYEQGKNREYGELIDGSLALLDRFFYHSKPLPPAPVWEYEKQSLLQNFRFFLEVEDRTYPDFRVYGLEQNLEYDWETPQVALRGTVDRISVKDGNHIIIDYKKKTTPAAGDIPADDQTHSDFQMPFYFHLMELRNLRVYAASYYSFENRRYVHVLNPAEPRALCGIDRMTHAVDLMKERIVQMADRLRAGDYSLHTDETAARCENCVFRGVCRIKYVSG
jgi:RecB family exonuclease